MRHYLQRKREKYISYPVPYLLTFYQSRNSEIKGYVLLCHLIVWERSDFL